VNPARLIIFGRNEKIAFQVRNGDALPDAKAFAALCRKDRKNNANAKSAAISVKDASGLKTRLDYRPFIAD